MRDEKDINILEPKLLILASAGSGKTYQLGNRVIGLVANGNAPEKIVALTFTRKAAGEFAEACKDYPLVWVRAGEDDKGAPQVAPIAGLAPQPFVSAKGKGPVARGVVDGKALHLVHAGGGSGTLSHRCDGDVSPDATALRTARPMRTR